MKRKYAMKAPIALLMMFNAFFFTSCSSFWLRHDETVDSVQQGKSSTPNAMVSKDQYDELARKYQELLNISKTQSVKNEIPPSITPVNDNQTKPEVGSKTNIDPSELVNHLDKAMPEIASVNTVDALKVDGPPVPTNMGVEHVNSTDDIDDQIAKLQEVLELVKANKAEAALTILKELENSKEKQIVVRAKMMLGDLLFNQGEFDLASQVYEEIIKKYAFSGYILKALGKLVVCSEKLKQPEKQARYYSLLHDFFEVS